MWTGLHIYKIEPVKIGAQKIERVYALRRRLEK